MRYLPWVNVLFGLWLIAAPVVLNFRDVPAAYRNDLAVGILVTVVSAIWGVWELRKTAAKAVTSQPHTA